MVSKRILYLSLLLVALLSMIIPLQVSADWEQFHGDGAHVGVSTANVPDTPSLIWMSGHWTNGNKTYAAVPSSSVVEANYSGDKRIFVLCEITSGGNSSEGGLVCLDASDGAVEWVAPVYLELDYDSWGSPTYHDGRVYVAGLEVYCFNWSGSEQWSYDPADWDFAVNGGPVVYDFGNGSKVVIAGDWGYGGEYHFINDSTGQPLGYFRPNSSMYCQGTPAVDANGYCYLTAWEYGRGNVWKVAIPNPSGGFQGNLSAAWGNTTIYDTYGSPTYYNGTVYVTTYNFNSDGELYAFNASNGAKNWAGPATIQRTDATPAVESVNGNTYIYVGGGCEGYSDLQTYCIRDDGSSYTQMWSTNAPDEYGSWTCSTAVGDNYVFTGKPGVGGYYFDFDGIYALNKSTGVKVWSFNHGGASPAVTGDGKVLTIGEGRVYCFGSSHGSYGLITYDDFNAAGATFNNTSAVGSGDAGAIELAATNGSESNMLSATGSGYSAEIYTNTSDDYLQAAQTFLATASGRLSKIVLNLSKVGAPTNDLRIQIRAASGVDDMGSEILAEKSLDSSNLSTTLTEKEIDFDNVNIENGQYYSIVLQVSSGGANNAGNCYRWGYGNAGYSGGKKLTTSDGWHNTTTDNTNDFYTKVYTKNQYQSSGDYISKALSADTTITAGHIYFDVDEPAGTDVKFQIRSAASEGALEEAIWYGPNREEDTYYQESGTTIWSFGESDQCFQIKAYLDTNDSGLTPALDDVFVTYE